MLADLAERFDPLVVIIPHQELTFHNIPLFDPDSLRH
jgi:hypothetical protein